MQRNGEMYKSEKGMRKKDREGKERERGRVRES